MTRVHFDSRTGAPEPITAAFVLGAIWCGGPDPCSWALCAARLAASFAFPLKPSIITAVISFLGSLAWIFFGATSLRALDAARVPLGCTPMPKKSPTDEFYNRAATQG
jgi:hypothetical protein